MTMHACTPLKPLPYLFPVLLLMACGGNTAQVPVTEHAGGTESPVDTMTFSAEAARIADITTDTVRTLPWQASVTAPGRLMLDPSAFESIGSITEGRITHVTVRVGDRVTAGQTLVMIHSHEIMDARSGLLRAKARLDAAIAERDLANTSAARAQRLFDARALSRAELERAAVAERVARAGYDEATAERDRAAALVEHLAGTGPLPTGADEHDVLIRTPISGVVTERIAQPGSVVLPGMPLVTVGDPRRLQLQLHLAENAATGIDVGSVVRYALSDAPSVTHTARVTRIAPTIDTLTRTVEVVARPEAVSPARAESFVQAQVLGQGTKPALVVPIGAIQAIGSEMVVFVAEYRGVDLVLRAATVQVGRRSVDRAEVIHGVSSGALVVVRGAAIAKAELMRRRGGLGD
ncbi:MAG TPA: efflux RND transporter periplasmic adaptor subunit [Gemmatimonas aurantiaca]|nr:efflux RND transporter periplasmic adaptor subunit [Gemmatimonas aurantiaca]HCT58335.1 efflux RND transporter periplasmic adaptor subunit [Gemmatimonas aurantiaca]